MKAVRFLASMYSSGMARTSRVTQKEAHSALPCDGAGREDLHRLDALLDEALQETFPASDPIAVTPQPKANAGNRR